MFEYAETLEGLEQAKAELDRLNERDSMDTSGNPDKYRTRINNARREVDRITDALKTKGVLERTEKELLNMKLDKAFPKARSKEVVEFEGTQYVLRFSPRTKSRSGKTVTSWDRSWERVKLKP